MPGRLDNHSHAPCSNFLFRPAFRVEEETAAADAPATTLELESSFCFDDEAVLDISVSTTAPLRRELRAWGRVGVGFSDTLGRFDFLKSTGGSTPVVP